MNAEQRARLKEIGKDAFVREEMTRLGFWPPSPETAAEAAGAEAQLRPLYEELIRLRTDLTSVEAEIVEAGDIPKLLVEIRRKRIERVRTQRAARKAERERERAEKRAADQEWRGRTLPFLGRGVSAGLRYEGGDAARLEDLGLPVVATAAAAAKAIGVLERELAWLTYHRGAALLDHYHRFTIPKKRGGVRVISSPKTRLRVAQHWLLTNVLSPLPVHDAAMAFRPGRSVLDNAARHAGRAVIVRIDLRDFFPSISFPRVKKLFQSFGYNEGIATIFALLSTEAPRAAITLDTGEKRFVAIGNRCLPQGACTSPAITNLLCRRLDARLTGAAQSLGFVFTRYADDLVFSQENADAPVGMLLGLVRRILGEAGFTVNEEKTAVLRPQHRQVVTGIVVNEAPHLSRSDLRRFRAFLHQCETLGVQEMSRRLGQDAQAYAAGYLSFIHMVSPEQEEKITQAHPWLSRWRPS